VVTPPLLDAPAVAVALLLQHSPVDTVMPPLQRPPPSKLSSNCHTILCQSNPLLRPYTATLALFHCYIYVRRQNYATASFRRQCVTPPLRRPPAVAVTLLVLHRYAVTHTAKSSRRKCYAPTARMPSSPLAPTDMYS